MSKQYKEAAEWCTKITMNGQNWEEKIVIFAKEGKLEVTQSFQLLTKPFCFESNAFKEIFEKIPISNPTLAAAIYEKVLNEFLRLKNFQVFKYLIKKWPCDIYDLECITNALLDAQLRDTSAVLLECLAIM